MLLFPTNVTTNTAVLLSKIPAMISEMTLRLPRSCLAANTTGWISVTCMQICTASEMCVSIVVAVMLAMVLAMIL